MARLDNNSWGIAFLVAAGIVYEIIAAACSSPQTTEINASTRAGTLMKWVHIGLAQSALFVGAEGSSMRVVAAASGRRLGRPVVAKNGDEAAAHFGVLAGVGAFDQPASFQRGDHVGH